MIGELSFLPTYSPRVYLVKAHVASLPTSPGRVSLPASTVPSPVSSYRSLAHAVPFQRPQCTRLFSQPSTASIPSFEPIRQVSAPCASVPNPFPRTPRIDSRELFQPPPRVTIATRMASVDSPRNTIVAPPQQQGLTTPPVEAHLPLKIRVVSASQKAMQTPRSPQVSYRSGGGWANPADPLSNTAPVCKGLSVMQKRREILKVKAQEMRAVERKLRQAEAERRVAEAERVRCEAERQRASLRQRSEDAQRRQQEQRESLAEELRRLAEAKRQVRREEAMEVERKRADAKKARQEAAARRTQGKLLVVEEKHRLAEEARRVSEEFRRKRLSLGSDSGRGSARSGRRSEVLDARRRAVLERGLTRRRAKSADAAHEREAEQRKAEQEKERVEKEEAERRRLRLEQQKRRAEESKQRIQEADGAWHAVLGLTATATLQEVKQAFRDLALLHHPDKGFQNCDDTFRTVRLAYQQAMSSFHEKAKAAGS